MSWLGFAYVFFAVVLGFFAGYYFVLCLFLRNQIIDLIKKLETAYSITDFLNELEDSESINSED